MEKSVMNKLTGFLLGGAIGAAIGLLSAPRAGHKTRDMLTQKGQGIMEMVVDRYQEKRDQTENMVDEVNQELTGRVEKLKEAGSKLINRERKVLNESAQEAKQAISS